MSEEEKQPYCDEYEAEKLVYNEQLKVYRNSTAYKRWLEAKMQGNLLMFQLCSGVCVCVCVCVVCVCVCGRGQLFFSPLPK